MHPLSDPLPAPPGALTIPAWWARHETSATRKRTGPLDYYASPGGNCSNGYLDLIGAGDQGLIALGLFDALGGYLATFDRNRRQTQSFLDGDGRPLPDARIALALRIPLDTFAPALQLLIDAHWITRQPTDKHLSPPRQALGANSTKPSGDDNPSPRSGSTRALDPVPPTRLVRPHPLEKGREGKVREEKGRGENTPHPPDSTTPTPTPKKSSSPHQPPSPYPTNDDHIAWLNSLHKNWRSPVLSGAEASPFREVLPLLAEIYHDPARAATIADYLDHRRKTAPHPWPRHRAELLEHLTEIDTKAADWAQSRTSALPNSSAGRTGTEVDLALGILPAGRTLCMECQGTSAHGALHCPTCQNLGHLPETP